MSSTKNTPSTQSTTSTDPGSMSSAVMSPVRTSTFSAPAARTRVSAISSICVAKSIPMTRPVGPTACEAASSPGPLPHATSRRVSPGFGAASSTVRVDMYCQKSRDASS